MQQLVKTLKIVLLTGLVVSLVVTGIKAYGLYHTAAEFCQGAIGKTLDDLAKSIAQNPQEVELVQEDAHHATVKIGANSQCTLALENDRVTRFQINFHMKPKTYHFEGHFEG